jgi:hypothetical protein
MSDTLERIKILVEKGEIRISEHGYEELAADGLLAREVVDGLKGASVLEDYPEFHKGPSVLVLEEDRTGLPVHAVWGIPRGDQSPAVLVTAYRPDPERWSADFSRRKK